MFGGNVNPSRSRDARTADSEHGGASTGKPLKAVSPGEGNGGDQVGDGFHHLQMDENESGVHTKHVGPDGTEDHADHGSPEEALAHAHKIFGSQDAGRDQDGDNDEPISHGEDTDMPDFSARYSS